MEVLRDYQEMANRLRGGTSEDELSDDGTLAQFEEVLARAEPVNADDVLAKALYIAECVRVDGGLVPKETVDGLVRGLIRVLDPARGSPPARAAPTPP
jgi:hypothetical protein